MYTRSVQIASATHRTDLPESGCRQPVGRVGGEAVTRLFNVARRILTPAPARPPASAPPTLVRRTRPLYSEGFFSVKSPVAWGNFFMKWLFDSLPFIEPYPTWVKALLSLWLVFSATCIAVLLVMQPAKQAAAEEVSWLKISGVKFNGDPERGSGVRVYAKVNGTTYTYPEHRRGTMGRNRTANGVRYVQIAFQRDLYAEFHHGHEPGH